MSIPAISPCHTAPPSSSLRSLAVYSPSLVNSADEGSADHVLYYYPEHTSSNEQLTQVGLCIAMTCLAEYFGVHGTTATMRSDVSVLCVYSPPQPSGLWLAATTDTCIDPEQTFLLLRVGCELYRFLHGTSAFTLRRPLCTFFSSYCRFLKEHAFHGAHAPSSPIRQRLSEETALPLAWEDVAATEALLGYSIRYSALPRVAHVGCASIARQHIASVSTTARFAVLLHTDLTVLASSLPSSTLLSVKLNLLVHHPMSEFTCFFGNDIPHRAAIHRTAAVLVVLVVSEPTALSTEAWGQLVDCTARIAVDATQLLYWQQGRGGANICTLSGGPVSLSEMRSTALATHVPLLPSLYVNWLASGQEAEGKVLQCLTWRHDAGELCGTSLSNVPCALLTHIAGMMREAALKTGTGYCASSEEDEKTMWLSYSLWWVCISVRHGCVTSFACKRAHGLRRLLNNTGDAAREAAALPLLTL